MIHELGIQTPIISPVEAIGQGAAFGPSGRSETEVIETTVLRARSLDVTMERFALPRRRRAVSCAREPTTLFE